MKTWSGSPSPAPSHFCTIVVPRGHSVIVAAKSKKKNNNNNNNNNKSQSSSEPSKKNEAPPPPRITHNIKQNLQIVKVLKEYKEKKASYAKPTPGYRKKEVEKDTRVANDEEAKESKGNVDSLEEDLKKEISPFHVVYEDFTEEDFKDGAKPVMLVDGYNVCGYWPKLKKHFMSGNLDLARKKLIDDLLRYSSVRGISVVVVFDAMNSGLPTRKENYFGVDVVFTGESTADTWIVRKVKALIADGCPRVWVATNDNLEKIGSFGAGAIVWSCKFLISEMKDSMEDLETIEEAQSRTLMRHKILKYKLDSKVVDALKDLKVKLLQNQSK